MQVDTYSDAKTDTHYLGLVRSLMLSVERMRVWRDEGSGEDDGRLACALLACLSRLHGTLTPARLFRQDSALRSDATHRLFLKDSDAFDRARERLRRFGLGDTVFVICNRHFIKLVPIRRS